MSQFKAARAEVEANLGAPLPRVPHVVVAPTDDAFAKRFQAQAGHPPSKTILAVAFPGKALVIIRASGIREGTDAGLGRTLRHELGHLVLGAIERQRGKRLPRWLNEGLCEWAAGRRPTLQERNQLNGWAKYLQLPRLEDLRETFPDHGNASARTYLVACGFLVYLDTKKSPRLLVQALSRSSDVDAAFQATYGAPVEDLEAEWKMGLADSHSILTSIATSFSAWSLAALLAILAGLRAYWKRRVLMRQLEQDDQREEEAEQAQAEIVRFPAPQENVDSPTDLDPPPGPTPKAPLG